MQGLQQVVELCGVWQHHAEEFGQPQLHLRVDTWQDCDGIHPHLGTCKTAFAVTSPSASTGVQAETSLTPPPAPRALESVVIPSRVSGCMPMQPDSQKLLSLRKDGDQLPSSLTWGRNAAREHVTCG